LETRIREAVRYLSGLGEIRSRFGLERIARLVEELGHPERAYRCVHIGGTNGKGSTAVLVAAALTAAGHRCGLYTSPHLVSLCERFRVDGDEIAAGLLAERIEEVRALAETAAPDDRPTFFEVVTAAAFRHFALERVEVAVLEVGLGGRLDATNIVDDPLVTVLTDLSIDHTRFLGTSIEDIAREKAGIVKRGRPVVSCWSEGPEAEVQASRCRELEAPLLTLGRDFSAEIVEPWRAGTPARIDYRGRGWRLDGLPLRLRGEHQVENAGLALAALEQVAEAGSEVDPGGVAAGFEVAEWPGRLEPVSSEPVLVVLDGAHNQGATAALARAVPDRFPGRLPRVLLLAVSADKDLDRLLAPLAPLAGIAVATSFGGPRALAAEDLARAAGRHFAQVDLEPDLARALARARNLAGPAGLVLATGSLFLVGRLRALLVGGEPHFRFE